MKRLALLIGLAITAGGVGGMWYLSGDTAASTGYATATAQRGSLENVVTAVGSIEPLDAVEVGAQVSGQVTRLHVEVGDTVQAGDLLTQIDTRNYEAAVASSRATLRGLEAQLTQRRAELRLAEQQFARQAQMLSSGATSQANHASAETQVQIVRAQIQALEADISRAQSSLDADEANLERTSITAPMAGTIMSLAVRQGQTVNANQSAPVILSIADLEVMTVWTKVSEADVGRLRLGTEAYFTTLGDPGRRWTGTLRQIRPEPEIENNVVLYSALFEVDNQDGRLFAGMTAQVFFVTESVEDAVIVPLSALPADGPGRAPGRGSDRGTDRGTDRADGRAILQVATETGIERREVTVGLRTRVSAEILAGLEPGERVVIGDAASAQATTMRGARGPLGF